MLKGQFGLQNSLLEKFTACRLAHMPVQYIIGHWDFLDFKLSLRPPVFIPRPETEELCEMVIEYIRVLLLEYLMYT